MGHQHWLHEAVSQLQANENLRRDTEILLEYVTGRGRTLILVSGEAQLTDEQCQRLDALLTHRHDGEPIAHLTGVREFWPLPLLVLPAILIPRPDTECLAEQALARLPEQPCRILGLGAGTGAIALTLASERPDCEIIAIDCMPDAVSLARHDAQHLAIKNIHILQSDQFSALAGQQFAMIVSNSPYIDEQNPHLQQGGARFRPPVTLVTADSGMMDTMHIIEQLRNAPMLDGFLPLEHGWQQGKAVRQAFILTGYHDVRTCCDYKGSKHVMLGRYYQ